MTDPVNIVSFTDNAPRRRRRGSKAAHPFFLLTLLLVAVLMSVSNIRGAVKRLPHHDDARLDNNAAPATSSSSSSSSFSSRTADPPDERLGHVVAGSDILPRERSMDAAPASLFEVPNNNNTVVTMISMGRLVESFVVERCIRSLRRRGHFTGTVLLFTDEVGYGLYMRSMAWDGRTRVVQGHDEDLHPLTESNPPQPRRYAQQKMVYKRFKTHHFKYIDAIPGLANTIRFVLYIDVDNIVGAPLEGFFLDYQTTVTAEYSEWQQMLATTKEGNNFDHTGAVPDFSFLSMFRDSHLRGKMHSGVILYDRQFEQKCTTGWRREMDTFWHSSDQTMLLRVLGNVSEYQCVTVALPPKHMAFASKRLMRQRKGQFPTFMHITNYRIKNMIDEIGLQEDFVRYVLYISDNETMVDGIHWEQVLPPAGGNRGIT